MLLTTTSTLQDRHIDEYKGVVSGEAILGAFLVIWLNTPQVREFFGARRPQRKDIPTAPPAAQPNP